MKTRASETCAPLEGCIPGSKCKETEAGISLVFEEQACPSAGEHNKM